MIKIMLGMFLSGFLFSVANATVIYNSDGTSSNIVGNTIYNSDGTSSNIVGNSIHNSDGTSSTIVP